ncbi:MAG: virulence factor MviN [Actinomycetales bacterium]|nr:virulence factor MviN [Actinomycetales bacterium]
MSSGLRRVAGGILGAAALIAVVTVVSRVLGFVRSLVFGATVGFDAVADAYNAANTLPNVVFEVAAGGALAGAVVPVLAAPLARGLRAEVDRTASALVGWVLAICVPAAALLAVLAHPLAGLVSRDPDGRALVAGLLAVFALQVPLYGLAVVLSGVLQAQKRFFWPAFAPVLSSLVVIGSYLAFAAVAQGSQTDASALPAVAFAWLAWGTTAGVAALSLPLLVPVHLSGVRLRPTLRFPEGTGRRVRVLALAGLGGLLAQQVAVLVALLLATRFGERATYSVYVAAQQVYLLPYAVLAVPLATSTFPRLAERAAAKDRRPFAELAARSTRFVVVASLVGVAVIVAAADAAAGVYVGIGIGEAERIAAMGPALAWTAPGLLGLGLVFHVSRALFALERGRLAVVSTAAAWGAVALSSLVACLVLVGATHDGPRTLVALGLGSSVGMALGGLVVLVALRRAAGPAAVRGVPRTLAVGALGAMVGALAGRWLTATVAQIAGEGTVTWILAGGGGALLAGALVLGVSWLGDRDAFTGLEARLVGARRD